MQTATKWIKGIDARDTVAQAGQLSLDDRLNAVVCHLRLAAKRADEDVEHVHQLRVATRRAIAALDLYAPFLQASEVRWLKKSLRRIRKAAGKARDLDVLAINHSADQGKRAQAFMSDVRRRRKTAQRPIREVYDELKRKRRRRRLARVNDLFTEARDPSSADANAPGSTMFGPWARARLQEVLTRFVSAIPDRTDDSRALHRFRIRGKELRYAIELLAPAFRKQLRSRLYPTIEELQNQLGEIHDVIVAKARFKKMRKTARKRSQAKYAERLLRREKKKLKVLRRRFTKWWTPEFQAQLLQSFAELFDQPKSNLRVSREDGRRQLPGTSRQLPCSIED